MRFAAVPHQQTQEPRSPAAEFIRKLLGGAQAVPLMAQQPVALPEPAPDLDQRVRLVGEW